MSRRLHQDFPPDRDLTPGEIESGDLSAEMINRLWGWYLGIGIVAILFGFFVLSFTSRRPDDTLRVITSLACALVIGIGVFEIISAVAVPEHPVARVIMGLISVGAGIAGLVWPHITVFVLGVGLGWVILLWGIFDLLTAFWGGLHEYRWLYLVRGILSIVIAIWAMWHPGGALVALALVIGIWAILDGVFDIVMAVTSHNEAKEWTQSRYREHRRAA
jgi:uncharacterized membrane protein HdeD (DUF308 family)